MIRTLFLATLAVVTSGVAIAQDDWSVEEFITATGVREAAVPVRERPGWRANPTILLRPGVADADALISEFPAGEFITVEGPAELAAKVAEADVILGYCTAGPIAAATRLVWVQIYSSGAERCLVVDEIRNGKVLLTNMQKMSSPAIGEHAVAMALSLSRGLVRFGKAMPEGRWRRDLRSMPGLYSVSGKTMLVVGLGGIGSAAAKRANALGMRVIATRNSSREGPPWVDYVGLSGELDELISEADIVVNALPLTDSTSGLFDRALFEKMKRGAHFINVGRGRTVVTDDLVDALESGHIAGAGLDVTDPEPLPADHPLWQMPNVIITPHISSTGADRRFHRMLLRENIRRYLAGEALLNVVDPERGY
jgi:phosphoglycerate dehydrogenase-like enzyme